MRGLKHIFAFLLMSLTCVSAFAENCFENTYNHFEKTHPKLRILSVSYEGILSPNEERVFRDVDVVNRTDREMDLFIIESAFMAKFIHLALVTKETCQVKRLIEIDVED